MEIKAKATSLRVSPRKVRLLTKGLRGLSPQKALDRLNFYPQKGVIFLVKLIKQARANAVNNFRLVEENLIIKKIEVNEGFRIKRMDKSHGARFDRGIIKKRTSHILLVLDEKETLKQKSLEKNSMVINKDSKEESSLPKTIKKNGTKS